MMPNTVAFVSALILSGPARSQTFPATSPSAEPDWREYRDLAESYWEEACAEVDGLGRVPSKLTWYEAGEIVRRQRPDAVRAAIAAATRSIHAAPGEAERSEALSYLAYLHLRLGEPDIALNALRFAHSLKSTTNDGVAYQRAVYETLGMPGDAERAALRHRLQALRGKPLSWILLGMAVAITVPCIVILLRVFHRQHNACSPTA